MSFRFPSNQTLAKICVYGAVASISCVMLMRSHIEEKVRRQDYFREAIRTLRSHSGAISLLGEPIKEMGFDLGNPEKNSCDGKSAKFEVAVKGSKERGTVFFSADRIDDKWNLRRIELELKSHPDKRLLIKKEDS